MTSGHEERACDSPIVQSVWRHSRASDGVYVAAADEGWDLLFIKQEDAATSVLLAGPTSRATPIAYTRGSEYFGVRFQVGTFLPQVSASRLRDRTMVLDTEGPAKFRLGHDLLELPTFENVEGLAARLAQRELVVFDRIVVEALAPEPRSVPSVRSVQRHFLQTTGLTQAYIRQIERARVALELLERGLSILNVVDRCGYSDQPHLTRSLKHLMGRTPAQVAAATGADELAFSYKTYP